MIHKATRVETRDHMLICHYRGGEVVEYDMKDVLMDSGTMIEPLKDKLFFAKVFLQSGVPTWPNGFDVCSEAIYRDGKHVKAAATA